MQRPSVVVGLKQVVSSESLAQKLRAFKSPGPKSTDLRRSAGDLAGDYFPGIFFSTDDLTGINGRMGGRGGGRGGEGRGDRDPSSAVGTFGSRDETAVRFEFQIGGGSRRGRAPGPPASVFDGAVPSSRTVDSQTRH